MADYYAKYICYNWRNLPFRVWISPNKIYVIGEICDIYSTDNGAYNWRNVCFELWISPNIALCVTELTPSDLDSYGLELG